MYGLFSLVGVGRVFVLLGCCVGCVCVGYEKGVCRCFFCVVMLCC